MSFINDIADNQIFVNAFKASMPYYVSVNQIWCDEATKTSPTPKSRSGFYCAPNYYIKKSDSCDTFY